MNNCGGQLGALQSRGTCWFYSILNGFILSTDGHAILFNYLNEFYKKLTKDEKAYFDSKNNAPCPLTDLTKVKQIYFWKFIDQYLCLLGGPRSIGIKAGRSVELLKNVNLAGEKTKINQGGKGALTQEEICRVLDHIGFKGKYDTRFAGRQFKFDGRKKPQFVVVRWASENPKQHMYEFPINFMNDPNYSLMCCGISIYNEEAKNTEKHRAHALTGFMCNGKGFIFDSNQMETWPCKWWIRTEMIRVIDENVAPYYPYFKHGQITYYGYSFAIFARNEFTKDIRPSCRLAHKKTKTPNVKLNFADPNLGKALNTRIMGFNPAEIAALKRKWARTEHRKSEYVSNSNIQFIVAVSNKREIALKKLATLLKEGKKLSPKGVELFNEKMEAKFPLTLSNAQYNSIVNSANSYEAGNKALDEMINAGYKIKSADNSRRFFKKLREKFPLVINQAKANSILENAKNWEAGNKALVNLQKAGYNINAVIYAGFYNKLGRKFPKSASPPKARVPSPPKARVPSPPKARSPSLNKINAIIARHNKRGKAHAAIMNALTINIRKHRAYINNKLNAKWPPPPPARSPSLNKINHLINMASTRQKALENVSANKTINVVKHRNYYSQKLREKFGSPSARSPSLNRIDAMINKANTRKKAVEYLAASAIDPVKHRNYYVRKMREKFGPTPRP